MDDKFTGLCVVYPRLKNAAGEIIQEICPDVHFIYIELPELKNRFFSILAGNIFRRKVSIFAGYDMDTERYLSVLKFFIFLASPRNAWIADTKGRKEKLSWGRMGFVLMRLAIEILYAPWFMGDKFLQIRKLHKAPGKKPSLRRNDCYSILYLKTDHVFGLEAGGSISHTIGVISGLMKSGHHVKFISSDTIPAAEKSKIAVQVIKPAVFFRNVPELGELEYNDTLAQNLSYEISQNRPDFIYQRYSLNNYAGLLLSRALGVPFVLEYNGSFPWMYRNWGHPLLFERLANYIETVNLYAADLVIVVSTVMRDELLARGVKNEKILVNPNGVDIGLFNPGISDGGLRQTMGMAKNVVVGFVGTFGPWHGAEILAQAAAICVKSNANLRFLWVGEGNLLNRVQKIVRDAHIENYCIFAGAVAHSDIPRYLAVTDILASPHVPNPDGTRFFGSPTKLFEYMAMGKAIAASDLEQIGEVLKDDKTAILAEPGNPEVLSRAILRLASDPDLRVRLGKAAYEEAINKYTWEHHVNRTIKALEIVLGENKNGQTVN